MQVLKTEGLRKSEIFKDAQSEFVANARLQAKLACENLGGGWSLSQT